MPFTSRDRRTLAVKLFFHLATSKRPIDYSKWPLPNIRACRLGPRRTAAKKEGENPREVKIWSRWKGQQPADSRATWRRIKKEMAPKRRMRHLWKQQQTIKMTSTLVCIQTRRSCRTWSRKVMWTRDPPENPPVIARDNGTEWSCCLPTDLRSVWIQEMGSKRFKQMQAGLGESEAVVRAQKHSYWLLLTLYHCSPCVQKNEKEIWKWLACRRVCITEHVNVQSNVLILTRLR